MKQKGGAILVAHGERGVDVVSQLIKLLARLGGKIGPHHIGLSATPYVLTNRIVEKRVDNATVILGRRNARNGGYPSLSSMEEEAARHPVKMRVMPRQPLP